MGRLRLGAILGGLGAVAALAAASANCAEPTEIIVDVRTDGCKSIRNTGIVVAQWEELDKQQPTAFSVETQGPNGGCELSPPDRIGTLSIHPNGSKDSEVAFKVVTGVTKNAGECAPPYDGCIVARRRVKFIPGKQQTIIVIMARACVGRDCKDQECSTSGQCVDTNGSDAATSVDADAAEPSDASVDAPADTSILEAGTDACALCTGAGTTCTNGTLCTFDCDQAPCDNSTTLCPPGIDCAFNCTSNGRCDNMRCLAPGRTCSINCTANGACTETICNAANCTVVCSGGGDRCDNVYLSGGDASLLCNGSQACNDNNNGIGTCDAGKCTMVCQGGVGPCPNSKQCAAGSVCVNW